MRKLLLLFVLLSTAGFYTANAQKKTNEKSSSESTEDYATLYVYRPGNISGAIVGYDLKVTYPDGTVEELGRVKNNSKFIAKLTQEGKVEITAKTEKKVSATLNVKFGEKYYLRATAKEGWAMAVPELTVIYPDQGESDFENLGKKKAKKKKGE